MIEVAILYVVLSVQPVRTTLEERYDITVCSSTPPSDVEVAPDFSALTLDARSTGLIASAPDTFTTAPSIQSVPTTISDRFLQLADDWSSNTGHVSSVEDLASHPSYRKIISLGWGVVPYLLKDLRDNKRFWFPALHAITGVRPFDPSDAGNSERMTKAWTEWGKRKGFI